MARIVKTVFLFFVGGLVCFSLSPAANAQPAAEAQNVSLVGHNDLNGNGDGGEGLAIQQFPDGRRVLYLAHEGQKTCLSIVDVTHPDNPVMINQLPSPVARHHALQLARPFGQRSGGGKPDAQAGPKDRQGCGCSTFPTSRAFRKPRLLQDLQLSFVDYSGPNSRGVHCLWFVDGEFAHVTTGTADFDPTNKSDDQFYMIVDLRDPRHPREVGRWWYPGTRKGDACLPDCLPARNPKFDSGYRPHQVEVWPDHPDRAYMAYIEGGVFVWISPDSPT